MSGIEINGRSSLSVSPGDGGVADRNDLRADDLLMIEQICDDFEASFRMGVTAPDIDGLVSTLRIELQPIAREELFAIAAHWNQQKQSPANDKLSASFSAGNSPDAIYAELEKQFTLERRLGTGATGEVWKATDRRTGELVAIKFPQLRLFNSLTSLIRFCREARWQARLRHPRIGAPEEIMMAGELPVLIARYVDGVTLRKYLDDHMMSVEKAVELIVQAADGLEYAHAMGIIHRDLKPANIILERTPDGTVDPSRPVIVDFGLAVAIEDTTTETLENVTMGTPAYMSPEQARGGSQAAGIPADIYSLGVILFETISGRLPIEAHDGSTLVQRVIHDPPASLSRFHSGVPADIEQICATCLSKEPAERYQSAREFAEDLRRWQRNETILMHRANAYSRFTTWAKKNPGILTSLVSVFLVVVTTTLLVIRESYISRLHRAYANETQSLNAARQSQEKLQSHLAAYRMAQIGIQLSLHNPDQARLLLEDCLPLQRTWEWRYYNRLLHRFHRELKHETENQQGRWSVRSIATKSDGLTLFSASRSGSLLQWDLEKPDVAPVTVDLHPSGIIDVACSPDDQWIAYGTNGGLGLLKRLGQTSKVDHVLTMNGQAVHSVAFSPDGRYVAFGGGKPLVEEFSPETGFLVVLQVSSGKEIFRDSDLGHCLVDIDWHPDGSRLMAAGGTASRHHESRRSSGAVLFWNTEPWERVTPIRFNAAVNRVAWSPVELNTFATGSLDGSQMIWDYSTKSPIHELPRSRTGVSACEFSADGSVLATATEDGICSLWRVHNASLIANYHAHSQAVSKVLFTKGNELITSGFDERIRFWDAAPHPDPKLELSSWGKVASVTQRLNTLLVAVNDPKTSKGVVLAIPISETLSADHVKTVLEFSTPIVAIATSVQPDSTLSVILENESLHRYELMDELVEATSTNRARMLGDPVSLPFWLTDAFVRMRLRMARIPGKTMILVPEFSTLASSSLDNRNKIWSCSDSSSEFTSCVDMSEGTGRAFAVSPLGDFFVTSNDQDFATVWTTSALKKNVNLFGHCRVVSEICIHADGNLMATGSWDQSVLVWDLPRSQKILELNGHSGVVKSIVFHPTEPRILSGGSDRAIHVWDTATGLETATLRGHTSPVDKLYFDSSGEILLSLDDNGQLRCW